jgi:hypothetical protein
MTVRVLIADHLGGRKRARDIADGDAKDADGPVPAPQAQAHRAPRTAQDPASATAIAPAPTIVTSMTPPRPSLPAQRVAACGG